MQNKINKRKKGFTHTLILALLRSFFDIFIDKFNIFFTTKLKEVNRQCNKKTMPRLVSGYTIIETMISVSLFLVVVMAGMGALLNANLLHQKSRDMRSIMDNLSFVMDDMSRNLRTGYNYHCYEFGETFSSGNINDPKSCEDGGWAIAFEQQDGIPGDDSDQWIYEIDHAVGNEYAPAIILRSTHGKANEDSFTQLTPEEVVITGHGADPYNDPDVSGFYVSGAEPPIFDEETGAITDGDKQQPFVTIRLTGTITSKGIMTPIMTPFSLQTSVSQRNIDFK